ncbi:24638_t:CDS:2, partial [Gigaspora rosea]
KAIEAMKHLFRSNKSQDVRPVSQIKLTSNNHEKYVFVIIPVNFLTGTLINFNGFSRLLASSFSQRKFKESFFLARVSEMHFSGRSYYQDDLKKLA